MNISLLEEYIVFAKHLSFSAAARELHLTQPALSTHMQNLESEVGRSLIQRGKPITLTNAGYQLLEGAQEIVELYHNVLKQTRSTDDTPDIKVVSGGSAAIADILKIASAVAITQIEPAERSSFLQILEKDTADIVFWEDFQDTPAIKDQAEMLGLGWTQVAEFKCVVCGIKDHPLAESANITAADIAQYPIVIPDRSHFDTWQACVADMLNVPVAELSFRLEPIDNYSNYATLNFKTNLCILSKTTFEQFLRQREDIFVAELVDGHKLSCPIVAIYRRHDPNPLVPEFIELIAPKSLG